MSKPLTLYQTTIGKKAAMAASGAILFGYLVGHLAGNLQVFAGPETLNGYAEFLHNSPALLWGTRIVLLLSFGLHIISSVQLTMQNFEARPTPYVKKRDVATTYAARTMVWSGPILLLFIVYHLLHLTLGVVEPGGPFDPHHVYNNLVYGFQNPLVAIFYAFSMLAVGTHLYHGLWSAFQTVGASHPRYDALRRQAATAITLAITVGFLSIPVAVMAGIVTPDTSAGSAHTHADAH